MLTDYDITEMATPFNIKPEDLQAVILTDEHLLLTIDMAAKVITSMQKANTGQIINTSDDETMRQL